MKKNEFPPSKVPQFTFSQILEEQEEQLESNPLLKRMKAARKEKADDPYRPAYQPAKLAEKSSRF